VKLWLRNLPLSTRRSRMIKKLRALNLPDKCPKCKALVASIADAENHMTVRYECGSEYQYSTIYDYREVIKHCR